MRFRPCIDIHNGKVKQIVGGSLSDAGDYAYENFVSEQDAAFFARLYKDKSLTGGHIIILNAKDSPYYEASVSQAKKALAEAGGTMQIGGGITADNAAEFVDAGASHVIVTSYVFKGGQIHYENLKKLVTAVGKDKLVLDLSCRARDGEYYIVTDRWQKETKVRVCEETLDELSSYCDEFLVHAVDVEGKQSGIETVIADILGDWGRIPVTYAGGVHDITDLKNLYNHGKGKLDVTVGSALEIFGGSLSLDAVIAACNGTF
ncbi:phosphoribosylformimino-5-aminoimidazole carboxamide ribotide isomerase [Butyrivibrio sp. AE3006]|uniref:phosphoribosylformimino-5-aminoimidazole carboxamide ribotide isomerase n=1 Tax=Butyrivibrio sp. AE3006 TaxID=1280673 RepID=UPI00040DEFF9|nr:phosphoribosylformimino-5-aminoimidazole carboxamide ribotide isomerase [Butyrivibrio sp. AE3006]